MKILLKPILSHSWVLSFDARAALYREAFTGNEIYGKSFGRVKLKAKFTRCAWFFFSLHLCVGYCQKKKIKIKTKIILNHRWHFWRHLRRRALEKLNVLFFFPTNRKLGISDGRYLPLSSAHADDGVYYYLLCLHHARPR